LYWFNLGIGLSLTTGSVDNFSIAPSQILIGSFLQRMQVFKPTLEEPLLRFTRQKSLKKTLVVLGAEVKGKSLGPARRRVVNSVASAAS
jgi:hypothetical protein